MTKRKRKGKGIQMKGCTMICSFEGALLPGAGILHIECSSFHSIIFQDLE